MAKGREGRPKYSTRLLDEKLVLDAAGWKTSWEWNDMLRTHGLNVEAPGDCDIEAVQFTSKGFPLAFILARSARRPGWWQLTEFARDGGPWGHRDFKTAGEGVKAARREAAVSQVVRRAKKNPGRKGGPKWESPHYQDEAKLFDKLGWKRWTERNPLTQTDFLFVEVPEHGIQRVDFSWGTSGTLAFVLTRSANQPGVWQLTSFTGDGQPWGHADWSTLQEGVDSARMEMGAAVTNVVGCALENPHVPAWLKKFDTGYQDLVAYISDDERVTVENTRRVVIRTPDGGKRRVRMWMLNLDRKEIGEFQSIQEAVDALVELGYMRDAGLSEGKKRKRAKMKRRTKKGAAPVPAPALAKRGKGPRLAPAMRELAEPETAKVTHPKARNPEDEVALHLIAWRQDMARLTAVVASKFVSQEDRKRAWKDLEKMERGTLAYETDLRQQYGDAYPTGAVIADSIMRVWKPRCIPKFKKALAATSIIEGCGPEDVVILLKFARGYQAAKAKKLAQPKPKAPAKKKEPAPRLAKMKLKPPPRMPRTKAPPKKKPVRKEKAAKTLKWSKVETGRRGTPNHGWTYIADAPGGQYDLDLSSSEQHPGGSGRKSYYVNFTPRGKKKVQRVVEWGVSDWRTIPAAKSAAVRHNISRLQALPAANPGARRGRGGHSRTLDPEHGRQGMTVAKLMRRMGL